MIPLSVFNILRYTASCYRGKRGTGLNCRLAVSLTWKQSGMQTPLPAEMAETDSYKYSFWRLQTSTPYSRTSPVSWQNTWPVDACWTLLLISSTMLPTILIIWLLYVMFYCTPLKIVKGQAILQGNMSKSRLSYLKRDILENKKWCCNTYYFLLCLIS